MNYLDQPFLSPQVTLSFTVKSFAFYVDDSTRSLMFFPPDSPDFKAQSRPLWILSPSYHYLGLWNVISYTIDLCKASFFPSSLASPS